MPGQVGWGMEHTGRSVGARELCVRTLVLVPLCVLLIGCSGRGRQNVERPSSTGAAVVSPSADGQTQPLFHLAALAGKPRSIVEGALGKPKQLARVPSAEGRTADELADYHFSDGSDLRIRFRRGRAAEFLLSVGGKLSGRRSGAASPEGAVALMGVAVRDLAPARRSASGLQDDSWVRSWSGTVGSVALRDLRATAEYNPAQVLNPRWTQVRAVVDLPPARR